MIDFKDIEKAALQICEIVKKTPLEFSERLSEKYNCEIYLKREDLNKVRSYKIRGAYNLISTLSKDERTAGVVCASAGNHAQGFAFACNKLEIKGTVYMPEITPKQKVQKVKMFGGEYIEVRLVGQTFDESSLAAKKFSDENKNTFVHPFDDERTIAGQGTVGLEIYEDLPEVNFIICPIGGGGIISGISTFFKTKNLDTKILGIEPKLANKTVRALELGQQVTLEKIDTFVDGAAVKTIGKLNLEYIKKYVDEVNVVDNGLLCGDIIDLYQFEGIVCEPAGALAVSGLEIYKNKIVNKKVVCIVSGGNNDISRYTEIVERSLLYKELKKYLLINFAQKTGSLRKFLDKILSEDDDITRFEYLKKSNKEIGSALVGLEFKDKKGFKLLTEKMQAENINFIDITDDKVLFEFLI
jgi:threonine dehydratase